MTLRILAKMASVPWAIDQDALAVMFDIADRVVVNETALANWKVQAAPARDALSTRSDTPLAGSARARIRDGVAIVPVAGPVFRYSSMMTEFSGATSLKTFAEDFTLAADSAGVRAILLDIDSPGGEITGMTEAAAMIRAAAERKPVVAFTEGQMASAAYQLGAAAREIVVADTAVLGSLGVVLTMTDRQVADERAGIRKFEIVSSQTPGKRPKVTTDAGFAKLQALADRLAGQYLADVAFSRGISVDALIAATDGGGPIVGVDAVANGLADRIAGFEETMARLASGDVPAVRVRKAVVAAASATSEEPPMTEQVTTPVPVPDVHRVPIGTATLDQGASGLPAGSIALPPGAAAFIAQCVPGDPVTAERGRAAGIVAATQSGFSDLARLAIDEGWAVETFVAAQTASAGAVAAAAQAAGRTAFAGSFPAPVAASEQPAGGAGEQQPEAAWDTDPEIRAEFGSKEAYQAFLKASGAGLLRIHKRP